MKPPQGVQDPYEELVHAERDSYLAFTRMAKAGEQKMTYGNAKAYVRACDEYDRMKVKESYVRGIVIRLNLAA